MHVSRRKKDEQGAAAVIFALLSVILLGVAALGTDVGNMVSRRTMSQTQADFAALAASHELKHTPRAGETPSVTAVAMVRDYLNHNQPQDDERECWRHDPVDCVTSAHLTDGSLTNGEVRMTSQGMEVTAPQSRVDFGLASIFGESGAYVDASATVTVRTGGVRVMPMFAVSACDYGRQTLTDPASGHVTPVVPALAKPLDANRTNLVSAVLRNSSGSSVNELPRDSTGNTITLKAARFEKTREIGFFRSDNPSELLIARQEEFWSPSDDPDGSDADSLPRTDLSVDSAPPATFADTYSTSPASQEYEVTAMIPDIVTQTEGVWWVRVLNGPNPGTWSPTATAIPIRVGGAVLECTAGSTDGNFGTLRLPRTDVPTGSELPVNIAVGLQSPLTPAVHQWAVDNPLLAGICTDGLNGAVESSGSLLRPGTNCVDTDTGLAANVATQGLISGVTTPTRTYPGVLTTKPTRSGCDPSGGSSNRTVSISGPGNVSFNNDVLTCYLTNTTTSLLDISSPTYAGGPVLDDDIYSAPRFVWVPVLKVAPLSGGSQRYSLVDFRPAFITDEQTVATATKNSRTASSDNGLTFRSNNVEQIKVIFFNVKALPTDGDFPTIEFLGVGNPIVRLVD